MAAAGHPGEDARLYDTVRAVGHGAVPGARHRDPGGQGLHEHEDGLAGEDGERHEMTAPLSLIVSAFAPVTDATRTLTPQLRVRRGGLGDTELVLIDLGRGRDRLGGSCLAQVYRHIGGEPPDLDDPALLRGLFAAIQELNADGCCWPTTTAPTAACSRPWSRWPSPGAAAWIST
jgi:phosphoribosylformylglycinamidine synthase